ncbi:alpha-amylase family glycosyl hydrolase [Coprococcus ammoniilyticus]|jgi:cyclomaltodextrinase|uniref:Alpha-amylase family glycosyl hydrolase n=1 Tax=Coprococcus ammoniilyticus TaxID=2981785 RepID=A0ABV1EFK9_9FIRM|nr:alpha-amylase family glycosyl hydrolase [Coprococcus ammoniilyticus]MCU6730160.1 alpha-amylase family glycosyl hydrolase [Coprococcus ammoniilyticus]RGH10785.1 glycosidase [Clostridium sp. AF15-31]SCH32426.1 Cyclomaltodextrinase [uncultured Coprococcus sp.]
MAWYDSAVFYHIYPLGLCGCPHDNNGETGAHFDKLNEWAEHAKRIGCNAIYIGPLFESGSHGYDTTDYRLVDRRLGTNDDFKQFVKNCHANDVKVIVDGVFNHTGRDFFAFQDIKQNRENSRYKDWYCNVNFWGNNEYNDGFSYDNWGGYNLLAKLNLWNPEVKNYHLETVKFWVDEFDIDGIRLDAADVLDFGFMKELRSFCNGLKPDFWLMGEVIHGDYSRWANNDMLHSVTNYELHKGLYSGHNDHNYFEIAHTIKRLNGIVGDKKLYTFCDNHDVARIYSKLNNKAHMYNVAILVYTVPGIPSIYYGSEFGIPGNKENGSDWNLRPDLNLADFNEKDELPALYTTLGHLKQRFPELTYGDYRELYLTTGQFAFARCLDGRAVVTALNNADNGAHMEINLPIGANKAVNLLTIDQTTEVQEDTCTDDATAKAWENARNELLDKAGQLVGASGEIRYKAEDIRKALEALETGADFGQAVWNLFGNLNDTMNNMHRVIGEFEQTMHKQERNSVAAGGDCTGGESLEIRDGKLIVDLPANKGVVVYLTNE